MVDPSPPVTRLRVADFRLGWLNVTSWSLPTEKLFQLMTARCEPWVIDRARPPVPIVACPRATVPSCGSPWAEPGPALTAMRPRPERMARQETLERLRIANIIPPPKKLLLSHSSLVMIWAVQDR